MTLPQTSGPQDRNLEYSLRIRVRGCSSICWQAVGSNMGICVQDPEEGPMLLRTPVRKVALKQFWAVGTVCTGIDDPAWNSAGNRVIVAKDEGFILS